MPLGGCCIESLSFPLDDLDPDCGLAFGRAVGMGVDGRLTGVFLFSLFHYCLGLALAVKKKILLNDLVAR